MLSQLLPSAALNTFTPSEDYFFQVLLPGCERPMYLTASDDCADLAVSLNDWPGEGQRWRFKATTDGQHNIYHAQRAGRCPRYHLSTNSDCGASGIDLWFADTLMENQAWKLETQSMSQSETFSIATHSAKRGAECPFRYVAAPETTCGTGHGDKRWHVALSRHREMAEASWRVFKAGEDDRIAHEYYLRQRELVMGAAAARPIHPYFAGAAESIVAAFSSTFSATQALDASRLKYENVVGARMAGMAKLLKVCQAH